MSAVRAVPSTGAVESQARSRLRTKGGRLLMGVLLGLGIFFLLSAGSASAGPQEEPEGGLTVGVAVANAAPVILQWGAAHEELLGYYRFEVVAADNNGVDDLSRIVVVFRDAHGVETRHEEEAPDRGNSTAGSWESLIRAQKRPVATPVKVTVEVHDQAGGVVLAESTAKALVPWPWHDPEEVVVPPGSMGSTSTATSRDSAGAPSGPDPSHVGKVGLAREPSMGHDSEDREVFGLFPWLSGGLLAIVVAVVLWSPPVTRGRREKSVVREDHRLSQVPRNSASWHRKNHADSDDECGRDEDDRDRHGR